MSSYSIVILICSATLSRSECQPETAFDLVRGPQVENGAMCSFNAQTMMARTDFLQLGGSQYMTVICARTENFDRWRAEIEARK